MRRSGGGVSFVHHRGSSSPCPAGQRSDLFDLGPAMMRLSDLQRQQTSHRGPHLLEPYGFLPWPSSNGVPDVKDHDVVTLDSIEDRVTKSADVYAAYPTLFGFFRRVRMI
jgi:hypothetical protein